ncbi:MAG TPA: hypothetical protein VEG34_03475 [Thermoanaerobaculia bacterium]|nr:hypothetical protein [Thermoanaerobaculia bacterium]
MSKRVLCPLSALVLAFTLAGPLAAFKVFSVQLDPAAPTSDDRLTVTVTGVSDTPCFSFQGLHQGQQDIEVVFHGCPILPPAGETPYTHSGAVGPLPAGTYRLRVTRDGEVFHQGSFTVVAAVGPCTPGVTALCLNERRFRVETDWAANGEQGEGQAFALTGETGAFSFFHPANVEVVVKVIDGCALNGRFWVFAAGLTDVRTEIAVTDAVTGARRTYGNPAGTPFAAIQDTDAFPCS